MIENLFSLQFYNVVKVIRQTQGSDQKNLPSFKRPQPYRNKTLVLFNLYSLSVGGWIEGMTTLSIKRAKMQKAEDRKVNINGAPYNLAFSCNRFKLS